MNRAYRPNFMLVLYSISTLIPAIMILIEAGISNLFPLFPVSVANAQTLSDSVEDAIEMQIDSALERMPCLHCFMELIAGKEIENEKGPVCPTLQDNKQDTGLHLLPIILAICCGCKVVGHPAEIKKKELHKKGEVVYNMRN